MNLATIAMINAALMLLEKAIPLLREWGRRGDITIEQQKELEERFNKLREQVGTEGSLFEGDHWKPSDRES